MRYQELENLAKEGKLTVSKKERGVIYRSKGWRGQKWDDTTIASWDNTQITYKRYSYEARTADMPEHSFYKITKKDFENLVKLLTREIK